jgi:signal transduction histidine kinase
MQRFYCLTPVLGGPGAPRYPVHHAKQIIGRSEEADVALLEPTVSRKHATIQVEEDGIWLRDEESKHGTFVNSKRISRHRLKVGDLIVIGLSIVLRLEESDSKVPPAEPLRMPTRTRNRPGAGRSQTSEKRTPSTGQWQRTRSGETALSWSVESKQRQTRELRRVKEDLVRARKLASVGAFCISRLPEMHDRLARLMESTRASMSGMRPGEIRPDLLMGELEQLYKVVDRLVSVSRTLPPVKGNTVSLEDPLRMAVAMVGPEAESSGYKLSLKMEQDLDVQVDPRRLALSLRHLLNTALQTAKKESTIRVLVSGSDGLAQVTISNEGDPIPAEVLSEVFDPFLTNSDQWLRFGLGLFEARQILMSFGGDVVLTPNNGEGTTIQATIPLVSE